MKVLDRECTSAKMREFYPPQIPLAKETHHQIDCKGFAFMGEPRIAEFVFPDDKLVLMRVLMDFDDHPRVLPSMRKTYDSEGRDVGAATAFPEDQTVYWFEPAGVPLSSEAAAPMFDARFSEPKSTK